MCGLPWRSSRAEHRTPSSPPLALPDPTATSRPSAVSCDSRPSACGSATVSAWAAPRSPAGAATRWTSWSRASARWRRKRPATPRVASSPSAPWSRSGATAGASSLPSPTWTCCSCTRAGVRDEPAARSWSGRCSCSGTSGSRWATASARRASAWRSRARDLHSRTALTEARLVAGSAALFTTLLSDLVAGLGNTRATRDFFGVDAHGPRGAPRALGPRGLPPGAQRQGGRGRAARPARRPLGGPRALTAAAASSACTATAGSATRRVRARAPRLRLPARACATRPTSRRAGATDLLTLDLQPELASGLGYAPRGGLLASELFMRDYYRRALRPAPALPARFLLRHLPAAQRLSLRRGLAPRGFEIQAGELHARAGEPARRPAARAGGVRRPPRRKASASRTRSATSARERLPPGGRRFRGSRATQPRVPAPLRPPRARGARRCASCTRRASSAGCCPSSPASPSSCSTTSSTATRWTSTRCKAIDALDEVAQRRRGRARGAAPGHATRSRTARRSTSGMLLHDIGKGRGGGHVRTA